VKADGGAGVEGHDYTADRNRQGTHDVLAERRTVGLDVAAIRTHTDTEETT